ncbi:YgaP family membrane protein [Halorubrum sp. N11]|uniref:YgaP family membrane protein n=1 Tax=Halorubrum sp. N11 TaxID=3402276 RepID=UPI003EBCEAFE
MNQNVGSTDKLVRTALGAVLGTVSLATLVGAVSLPALAAPVLGVASLLMLGTAARGSCLLYSLLGVDTCPASAGGSR